MTESYLTTDIIVIIVLVVVLVLIGLCAFLTHFYWTKIGVAEIWNTAKWSSMRSSVYQAMGRLSRASSKRDSNRPFSAASVYSDNSDGSALPAPLRNNNQKSTTQKNSNTNNASKTVKPSSANSNTRRNSSNQVQPVSSIVYNNSVRANYGTKIGQPLENTKIHNVHESDDQKNRPSENVESYRF